MMVLAPFLALHLLASTQGQLSDKEKQQVLKAQKMAQDPNAARRAQQEAFVNGQPPKTCNDRCDFMKKSMKTSCDNLRKTNPAAGQRCGQSTGDIVKTCYASCSSKGKIDPEYMKNHVKMPKQGSARDRALPGQ